MQFIKKALLNFVLPLVITIILLLVNYIYGLVFAAGYILYVMYRRKTGIYVFIGKMHYSRGNTEKALEWFNRAIKTGKAKPKSVISYAYLLLKTGNINDSEKILNNLLATRLETEDVMIAKSNLALCIWKRGQIDNAVEMLEDIIKDFKTSTVYGSLGYLLLLKGDIDKALEFNLEAYEYNSSNKIICDNLGQAYYLKGEFDKALELYTRLIAENPSFPEAYYNYGLVLMQKNEVEKALENFRKAQSYKITFLSTVTSEEIEEKIKEAGG